MRETADDMQSQIITPVKYVVIFLAPPQKQYSCR